MKKLYAITIILLLAVCGYAQERADVVEAITPSPAVLFVKTSRLKNFVESLKFTISKLLPAEYTEKVIQKRDEFKKRTGVDFLDIESLKKAGVDVNRSASIAMYNKGRKNEERILVFIPVYDEKLFPLKFVELIKKNVGNDNVDLNPVISEYKNFTLYQMRKDIFFAALDGVFIIASTGELIQSVIDVKVDNAGFLDSNPLYMDYLDKTKKNYDLRAYVTRDLLKDILLNRKKEIPDKMNEKTKGNDPLTFNNHIVKEIQYNTIDSNSTNTGNSELKKMNQGPSPLNSVDYVSVGIIAKPTAVNIDVAVKFNTMGTGGLSTFLDFVKTGQSAKALYMKNTATYSYISIDFNKIEDLCKLQSPGCVYYNKIKSGILSDLGIDFAADVLPSFSGVMNIIAGQPKGAGGGYVLYLPMNDQASARKVLDKSSAYLKEKYKGTERFGTVKIGGTESFWYIDSKNSKNFVACDKRGLYLGNETALIAMAMTSEELKDTPAAADEVIKTLGNSVFFLANIKKESFFGALIMLQAYRSKEISNVVDAMSELYIIGKKLDQYISLEMVIKLLKRK